MLEAIYSDLAPDLQGIREYLENTNSRRSQRSLAGDEDDVWTISARRRERPWLTPALVIGRDTSADRLGADLNALLLEYESVEQGSSETAPVTGAAASDRVSEVVPISDESSKSRWCRFPTKRPVGRCRFPKRRIRQSRRKDELTHSRIKAFEAATVAVRESATSVAETRLDPNPQNQPLEIHPQGTENALPTPRIWKHLTNAFRCVFYHRAVIASNGVGFTLNLSSDVEQRALASGEPAAVIQEAITRAVKRVFGRRVGFWFVLETTREGRLHLHGGIAATINEASQITEALIQAAGRWSARRGAEHQLHLEAITDDVWPAYACKGISTTAKTISTNLVSVSNDLRSAAKAAYGNVRNNMLMSK